MFESIHQAARADSVSLSDSGKEPSGDSEYRQPGHHTSADSDYSDDSTSGRGRCACPIPHAPDLPHFTGLFCPQVDLLYCCRMIYRASI